VDVSKYEMTTHEYDFSPPRSLMITFKEGATTVLSIDATIEERITPHRAKYMSFLANGGFSKGCKLR
jgi:hypothetical protein